MTERVQRLRQESSRAQVTLSSERAKAFEHLCRHKTLWIGADELVVGERGPRPKAVPTYPELTCHSEEDIRVYKEQLIPFWQGRTMRVKIFERLPDDWKAAYAAGARAHHLRWEVLLEGASRLQGGHSGLTQLAEFSARPERGVEARGARGDAHRL